MDRRAATLPSMTPEAAAREIAALFPRVYESLHAVRPRGERLTMQGLAILLHLSRTGPLTIAELSRHLDRAQSVVSEIVTRLARREVLERVRDERDRRRTLVWLTPHGIRRLREETSVLSTTRIAEVLARRPVAERRAVVRGLRLLVEAATQKGSRSGRYRSRRQPKRSTEDDHD